MTSAHATDIVATRLTTFSAQLDKIEAQWAGRDLAALASARLAPDMHPLYWQIAAVAQQALGFAGWCEGENVANSVADVTSWSQARERLDQARAALAGLPKGQSLPASKRIDIEMAGMYLELTGQRYVDEWLLPNLYFHLNIAYAIARSQGADLGKADVLANLMPELRPIEPAATT